MPAFVRAEGGVRLHFARAGEGTAALGIAESGGYRVRFPRTGEGVLINTGGGMTGGDRMRVEVRVDEGAKAVLTTQAAEKIYRSDGPDTEIAVSLDLASGSHLHWIPQEQILFDGARLRRALCVSMAADARLTLVESAVFGRWASGEVLRESFFRDRWRIRRDGRLVFAEEVRLEGDVHALLARKALGDAARATATFLHIAPDAESRVEEARALLDGASSETGASAFEGCLVSRFLARDPQGLRADLARFLEGFRQQPLPRSWQS